MTRKLLLLPALAAALLAGCATYGYDYRGGTSGDYYYGQPGSNYDDYGYPGYYGGYGYPGYGAPYWGGSIGYYGYYGPSYGGGHHHDHDHDHDGDHDGGHHGGHHGGSDDHQAPPAQDQPPPPPRPRPPWRDLGNVARPQTASKLPPPVEAREASTPRMRAPAPAASSDAVPVFPRGGGRKRDAHPTPGP